MHGVEVSRFAPRCSPVRTGVKEVDEKVWLISFMHYDLGFFDHESNRFECAISPFAAKVLPMSSV